MLDEVTPTHAAAQGISHDPAHAVELMIPGKQQLQLAGLVALVVLDLDNDDAIAEAERRGLHDTLIVRTGNARHVHFRHHGYKITVTVARAPRVWR